MARLLKMHPDKQCKVMWECLVVRYHYTYNGKSPHRERLVISHLSVSYCMSIILPIQQYWPMSKVFSTCSLVLTANGDMLSLRGQGWLSISLLCYWWFNQAFIDLNFMCVVRVDLGPVVYKISIIVVGIRVENWIIWGCIFKELTVVY